MQLIVSIIHKLASFFKPAEQAAAPQEQAVKPTRAKRGTGTRRVEKATIHTEGGFTYGESNYRTLIDMALEDAAASERTLNHVLEMYNPATIANARKGKGKHAAAFRLILADLKTVRHNANGPSFLWYLQNPASRKIAANHRRSTTQWKLDLSNAFDMAKRARAQLAMLVAELGAYTVKDVGAGLDGTTLTLLRRELTVRAGFNFRTGAELVGWQKELTPLEKQQLYGKYEQEGAL